MIVGETIEIFTTRTRTAAWQATDAAVQVTLPDGTSETGPSVTVTPPTESTQQTLSFLLSPSQGGEYGVHWEFGDGQGETIVRQDVRFALWTDAKPFLLTRLQRRDDEILEPVFEREIASIARLMLSRWPQIGNPVGSSATMGQYSGLTGSDREFFDEAAALLVCARLVGPLATQGAPTDIVVDKAGDEQSRFAQPDGADADGSPGDAGAGPGGFTGVSERKRWMREAAERIGRISVVAQSVNARGTGFTPMRVWGPSRSAHARGQVQTLLSDVIRLLSDSFDLEPAMHSTGV